MTGDTPKIAEIEWGRTEVTGYGTFKDVKIWPGGAREWDWTETGTDHEPGVQPEDVEEVLDGGAETVIVSQGQQERLNVPDETIATIEDRGASAEVLPTPEAVERHNELASDGEQVGSLIHSTC